MVFVTNFRSQLGTICFGSSPISPFVNLALIFQTESLRWHKVEEQPIIGITVFSQFIISTSNDSIYTMMLIYGMDYVNSAKKVLDLIVENPWKFFVLRFVSLKILLNSFYKREFMHKITLFLQFATNVIVLVIQIITTFYLTPYKENWVDMYNNYSLMDDDLLKHKMIHEFLSDLIVFIFIMLAANAVFVLFFVAMTSIHICTVQDDLQNGKNINNIKMSSNVV